MNCQETEQIIHGYLDGELDLVRSIAVEQHLKECTTCDQAYRERQSLRTAIAGGARYFNAPESLKKRLRSAIREASHAEVPAKGTQWRWKWNWSAIFSPIAAAALVLFVAVPLITARSDKAQLVQEIVSAHVRSLMADTPHLTDIPSSDQHTVKPWFTGKLTFSPTVTDFAAQGFRLVGGRLDYIEGRPVAALVYQRRKHLINLFIWPQQASTSGELRTAQGYNVIHWYQGGMAHWAVSDVNRDDLREFEYLVQGGALPPVSK